MSDKRPVSDGRAWPDNLSTWVTPPGEVEPIRVFDSAEAAMRFLALRYRARFNLIKARNARSTVS
jgi:hypothetical protein